MEDLIKLIVQQVNITEEQARATVNTILEFVQKQLPAPMAAQLESFLASAGAGRGWRMADRGWRMEDRG
jgi:hypothetical protein